MHAQRAQAALASEPLPRPEEFPAGEFSVLSPISRLLVDRRSAEIVHRHLPALTHTEMLQALGSASLLDIAAVSRALLTPEKLRQIATELSDLCTSTHS
ncbi:hypothetical protein ACFXPS_00540 [Nocardia sp. NPDC059091]|uniref:hypothetical protein n=1 Tax=unclassified Nocardia TaxID=2637762 RepID=UPI003678E9FE